LPVRLSWPWPLCRRGRLGLHLHLNAASTQSGIMTFTPEALCLLFAEHCATVWMLLVHVFRELIGVGPLGASLPVLGSLSMLVGLQPHPGGLVNVLQGGNVPFQFARKYDWSHNDMLLRGRAVDGCFRRRSGLNQAVMGICVFSSAVVFSSSGFGRSSTSKITLIIKLQLGHTAISSLSLKSAMAISNLSPQGQG